MARVVIFALNAVAAVVGLFVVAVGLGWFLETTIEAFTTLN